jgi:hypothetical protein
MMGEARRGLRQSLMAEHAASFWLENLDTLLSRVFSWG